MKLVSTQSATIGALLAAIAIGPAMAQTTDISRGVRIIDGPEAVPPDPAAPTLPVAPAPTVSSPTPQLVTPAPAPPPLPPTPSPAPPTQLVTPAPAPAPLMPSSSLAPLLPSTSALPQLVAPSPEPTSQTVAPGSPPDPAAVSILPVGPSPSTAPGVPAIPAPTAAAPSTYDVMSLPPAPGNLNPPSPVVNLPTFDSKIAVANPAELSIDILPGADIKVGSRVTFRVNTKKAGYLILIDVDSSGKLTQIFPNPMSLLAATSDRLNPHANYIKPGAPIQIPDPKGAVAGGYEFVASLPLGTAMVVAILSDRPVQLIDLPDVPSSLVGQAGALAYLNKIAGELRVAPADGSGPLLEPKWSLDAKFYAIR